MGLNLLDLLKGQIGEQVIEHIGGYLSESPSGTKSAIDAILPSILGGLMSKVTTKEGAGELSDFMQNSDVDGGILDGITDMFSSGNSGIGSLISMGGPILKYILGDKSGGIIDIISSVSGIGKGSSSSLLGMIVPIVMGMLSRQKKENNLDAFGMADLLMSQKDHIKDSLPAGFSSALGIGSLDELSETYNNNYASIFDKVTNAFDDATDNAKELFTDAKDTMSGVVDNVGDKLEDMTDDAKEMFSDAKEKASGVVSDMSSKVGDMTESASSKISHATERTADTAKEAAATGFNWFKVLLPLLLLVALGYFLMKSCGKTASETTSTVTEQVEKDAKAVTDAGKNAADKVVDGANAAAETVKEGAETAAKALTSISLPGGASVQFPEGSFGIQLADILAGKAENTGGINLGGINFAKGTATIEGASSDLLVQLANLLKAYGDAKVRLDAHTDEGGSAVKDKQLSTERANALKDALVKNGVNEANVEGRGYGSARPLEGANNRIELMIKK